MRGLVKTGAIEAVEVSVDDPYPAPDPDHAPPALEAAQADAASDLRRRGSRARLRALPARRRHRIGQDRSLFRGDRRGAPPGPPDLVLLPEIALTEPFLKRFAARFGHDPVAWHSGLRQSQRRRAWRAIASGDAQGGGRRALGAVPALSRPRPDRRRRGARDQLQAGGRRPVSRPRRRGDARQARGRCRSSSPRRRRRSRPGRWPRSASIARSSCPTATAARSCPTSPRST